MRRPRHHALLAAALAALFTCAASSTIAGGLQQATDLNSVIDAIVAAKVADNRITAAQALVAREQLVLQFGALSAEAQASLLAKVAGTAGPESVARAERALQTETQRAARKALAATGETTSGSGSDADEAAGSKPKARLGFDGDYVFVPTVGPCRVADSRFAAAGSLGALAARQLYAYSVSGGYAWSNQGGTGTAGAGNCFGTEFIGVDPPVAVVATVAVTNTSAGGSMRAWNGGTNLTVGGILGWGPGQTISNTTVIPVDRAIAAYPGSGGKRDFGLYNNSGAPVDYIIDVVGYFAANRATPLDCYVELNTSINLANATSTYVSASTCEAGYSRVTVLPFAPDYGLWTGTLDAGGCRISNNSGATQAVACDSRCCRIPGR